MVGKTTLLRALCLSAALAFPVGVATAQDAKSAEYSALLSQISDKKLSLMQQEVFAAHQSEQMDFLKTQISGVSATTADVDGMLTKMVAQLERAVTADLPFLREERLNRIAKLNNDLEDSTLSAGAKYRLALSAYQTEVNYGMSVEDYDGERPLNDGESAGEVRYAFADLDKEGNPKKNAEGEIIVEKKREQGTYLRYGRVALVYMDDRLESARRYDQTESKWLDVKGADLLEVRKAVRVARGEVAPAVVMAPTRVMQ